MGLVGIFWVYYAVYGDYFYVVYGNRLDLGILRI